LIRRALRLQHSHRLIRGGRLMRGPVLIDRVSEGASGSGPWYGPTCNPIPLFVAGPLRRRDSVAPTVSPLGVTEFDQIAQHYDEARGGERRGAEYARPTVRALLALPATEHIRRATAEMIVLQPA
jgi:hypothetical protein